MARADFDRQLAFLAERSPQAARRLSEAILKAAAGLRHTNSGRIGRVEGTLEKLVRRQPYIILFEMTDVEVQILRPVHTSRDWPEGEMPPP